jgi:hypothetical protein
MNQLITRSLTMDDMHVERTAEGRTIVARALTYNVPYRVSDDGGASFYKEIWRTGVFAKSIAQRGSKERIPLLTLHDRRKLPVGAVIGVEDGADFIFRAKVSNTAAGDEALELVNDGVLTGVSVGARILTNRAIQGGVERIDAILQEISLAPATFMQMPDAGVLAVRALLDGAEDVQTAEDDPKLITPSLDAARAILAGLARL